jgi:hypothetical protein
MADYTKIKSTLNDLIIKLKLNDDNTSNTIINDEYQIENKLKYIDENELIQTRLICLNLFEKINEALFEENKRYCNPPLFDLLTIEDLIELLYPNYLNKMIEMNL